MKIPFAGNWPFRRAGYALAASAGLLASQAAPADVPRHVVLIHGIWDTLHTMRKMEGALRSAGFDPIVVVLSPNGGELCLDALAEQVRDQIDRQLQHGERFSIIGFSMGGLVARSYLRQFGDPKRVATFISIASPHQGTLTAWLNWNAGVRDMRPGSAFLKTLDLDATRFSATRWVTIRTPLDLMILPSTSSILPWAKNYSIPVLMHPLLVLDGRVIACAVGALVEEPVSTKSAHEPPASRHGESPRPRSADTPRHH